MDVDVQSKIRHPRSEIITEPDDGNNTVQTQQAEQCDSCFCWCRSYLGRKRTVQFSATGTLVKTVLLLRYNTVSFTIFLCS